VAPRNELKHYSILTFVANSYFLPMTYDGEYSAAG
jgi:hypothetical protein